MHVSRSDVALEYFLQWLERTMLACDLVSIRLSNYCMLNDAEHVDVCVDHKKERTPPDPIKGHLLHLDLQ